MTRRNTLEMPIVKTGNASFMPEGDGETKPTWQSGEFLPAAFGSPLFTHRTGSRSLITCHQKYLLMVGLGGYRFTDHIRMGALLAVRAITTTAFILSVFH